MEVVHNDERLAASFFEGHRGDGPTFITFVIRPDEARVVSDRRLRWEQRWTSGGNGDNLPSNPLRRLMKGEYSRPECNSTPSTRFLQIRSKLNLLDQLWNQRVGAENNITPALTAPRLK